ncbi:MAG: chromosomal replication initiator protein DnaA [Clostridia bacterium]|nr:chromosomal replication initiator protein DnaA [Clostridia bacterium]
MDSFAEIWNLVREDIRASVKETAFNVWLSPLEFVKYENDKITLRINADYKRNVILDKFSTQIRDSVETVFGFPVDIDIILPGEENIEEEGKIDSATKKAMNKYDYCFENFVVGPTNKFAHAAAVNVANNPGERYNPLFIYGHSGLGKTHLLCAIQKKILENNPKANIIYTSGELFTNELIHYLSLRDTHSFHEKYRNVDVLLVDDIQFISKTDTTQEEFFHTFDFLIQKGKQVVLTSDRPPKEMVTLEERLRNRFEWGLMADIQPPSVETRMAIVKLKGDELGINLGDDVIRFIAEHIKKNVRQLEGIVKKIEAYNNLYRVTPTLQDVQEIIADLINDEPPLPVAIDNIIKEVGRIFNVSPGEIRGEKRTQNIVLARQVAMYIVHETTNLSLQNIGNEFGNKHYTTVMHSLSEIESKMSKNVTLRATVDDVLKNLQEA